jgi:hypothetical protein
MYLSEQLRSLLIHMLYFGAEFEIFFSDHKTNAYPLLFSSNNMFIHNY